MKPYIVLVSLNGDKNMQSRPILLTVMETASLLRIQRAKVYLLIESGCLKGVKIGSAWRIRTDSVEALIGPIDVEQLTSSRR